MGFCWELCSITGDKFQDFKPTKFESRKNFKRIYFLILFLLFYLFGWPTTVLGPLSREQVKHPILITLHINFDSEVTSNLRIMLYQTCFLGYIWHFFAILLVNLKRGTFETTKDVCYWTSKTIFLYEVSILTLEFCNLKFCGIMKFLNVKQIHLVEKLAK